MEYILYTYDHSPGTQLAHGDMEYKCIIASPWDLASLGDME